MIWISKNGYDLVSGRYDILNKLFYCIVGYKFIWSIDVYIFGFKIFLEFIKWILGIFFWSV